MRQAWDYQKIQIEHMGIQRKLGNSLLSIKPGVLCVFDENAPSNTSHFHRCFELCIVTEGSGFYRYGGNCLAVKKGDVFIADPGDVHEITLIPEDPLSIDLQNRSLHVFHFSISIHHSDLPDKNCGEEGVLLRFLNCHDRVRPVQNRLLAHLNFLSEYGRVKSRSPLALELAIVNLVLDSLCALTRAQRDSQSAGRRKNDGELALPSNIIDVALLYIARHMGERITLDDVARAANTSKRNLQILFGQHLNATVSDYIARRKMSVASSYLRMNFRVKEVGPKVGIADAAQFCRVFKKHYGMSPKQYQLSYAADGVTFAAEID